MPDRQAKQVKRSDHQDRHETDGSIAEFGPVEIAAPVDVMQAQAAAGPRLRRLAPAAAMRLQRTVGNAVVQRILYRARPQVQRDVLPQPIEEHTPAEVEAMTLSVFHTFATKQVDWFNKPAISDRQRWQFRGLLTFANRAGILSGCGEMTVKDLLATGVISNGGEINAVVAAPLDDYGQAVKGDVPSVEIQKNAPDPATALKWGAALKKLLNAPGLGGAKLKHAMHQDRFVELVNRNFVDDFVSYMQTCSPIIEAEKSESGADDIASYIGLRNDGIDPVFYKGTVLNGNVLNFHRFNRQTLDALVTHFQGRDLPNATRKPLTLILHSAHDHNAAFHRDPNMVAVVTNGNINTLMIEGKETLADVASEIKPLAEAYGKDKSIDQVMFAGHGNARSIELGSKEGIDLDSNAAASNALFDEVLKNMSNDPGVSPHRRIVFNACLTNSNSVPMPLNADRATAQKQIRDHISANSSLATYLKNRAKAQGLNNIDVKGSNGSFGQVQLIDAGDGLDIISVPDPSMTSDKVEYVKTGTEPEGVLRAALECWAGFNMPDAEIARQDTLKAMDARAKVAATDYDSAIINTLFSIIVARYGENGEMIRLFADVAYRMSELKFEGEECHVDKLTAAGLGAGGTTATEAKNIFGGVIGKMAGMDKAKLVVYQVWMKHETAKRADFMTTLAAFDCQTIEDFLDVPFVTADLAALLPISPTPTREQLLLAFRVIATDDTQAEAKAFLLNAVGTGNTRFPAALGVGAILAGRPDENTILEKLGLAAGGAAAAATTDDRKANLDLDGDGTNETYVEPLPGVRGASNVRNAPTFKEPDISAARVRFLWKGQRLYLVGQTGDFYAIHNPWVPRKVIFVEKANVAKD